MAVGGDIVEITYNHPTLGTATFYPKAGEDNEYDEGGYRTEDDENMVDGGGNPIWVKRRKMGGFTAVIANDTVTNEELHKTVALAEDSDPAEWTLSLVNGTILSGTGMPVGDLKGNIGQATFSLKVACPKLTPQ